MTSSYNKRNNNSRLTNATNSTNTPSDDNHQSNQYHVRCYSKNTTHQTQYNTLCLMTYNLNEYNGCMAMKNDTMCRSCFYTSALCFNPNYGSGFSSSHSGGNNTGDGEYSSSSYYDYFVGGYKIDCSNVDYRYGNVKVCGDRMTAYASSSSSGGSNTYHHGNSSSNGDDGIYAFLSIFKFLIIPLFVCAGLAGRRARRNITPTRSSGRPVLPTERTRLLPVADEAVAKEELLDNHDKFEFFSADDPQDVIAEKLKTNLKNGDWESVRDTLQSLKEGVCNNDERAFYFSMVVDEISESWPQRRTQDKESYSPLLDDWIATEPDSVDCRILRAETGTAWAWQARSVALAHLVEKRQWELFYLRLDAATIELNLARELCPRDALIYGTGIPIAMGLRGKNKDAMSTEQCLECLSGIGNEPLLYRSHVRALQFYCRKWHGSHEKMFEYARSVTSQLPDGHPLWVLIPMAHYERNLIGVQRDYWTRSDVVLEVVQCYKRAFPTEAETVSTSNAPYEKSQEWACRNYYAYALARSRQFEMARRQIRMIGRRPTKIHPWNTISKYKLFIDAFGFDITEGYGAGGGSGPIVAAVVV